MNPYPASSRAAALVLMLLMLPGVATAQSALPAVQTQGSVSYLSGGIGADESAAIKAVRDQYPLSILLSAHAAAQGQEVYLSAVPVTIRDATGKTVLSVTSDGPYLLARLPPGRYEVSGDYQGQAKRVSVTVGTKPQRLSLAWPQANSGAPSTPAAAAMPAAASTPPAIDGVIVEPVAAVAASTPQPALPAVNTDAGVPYISGGIGADESAAIKAAASRYSLSVTLTGLQDGRNVYLSSVPVTIRDAAGATVLDVVSQGPYLLADLPSGQYRVSARYAEQEKTSTTQVAAGKSARVSFVWP